MQYSHPTLEYSAFKPLHTPLCTRSSFFFLHILPDYESVGMHKLA